MTNCLTNKTAELQNIYRYKVKNKWKYVQYKYQNNRMINNEITKEGLLNLNV